MNLIVARFRNVPVLAEKTAQVAAGCAHTESARGRHKMVERFFFDGSNLQGRGRAVAEAVKLSAAIDADETETGLAWMDMAMTGAKKTVNAIAGLGFPPAAFVEGRGVFVF